MICGYFSSTSTSLPSLSDGLARPGPPDQAGCQIIINTSLVEGLYAGPHLSFIGLDQGNVRLPQALIGRGEVEVVLTVNGKLANTVTISVK